MAMDNYFYHTTAMYASPLHAIEDASPIVIELAGGLGNQLFQYAFGQYLSMTTHRPVLYDCRSVKRDVKRKLLLTAFAIDSHLFIHSQRKLFSILGTRIHTSLSMTEKLLHRLIPPKNPHAHELLVLNDDVLFPTHVHAPQDMADYMTYLCRLIQDNVHKPVYCRGYWQYEYITIQNKKMNIAQLYYHGKLRSSVVDLVKKLNTEHHASCALHIRRGDYLVPSIDNILPRITQKYYRQAVDIILKKEPNTHFYVFSDDAQWCTRSLLSVLGTHISLTVVSDAISTSPIEDMILMSYCRHKILANSSFSWWAAHISDVLSSHSHMSSFHEKIRGSNVEYNVKYTEQEKDNPSSESITIAPLQWFTHNIKNNLIVPSSWQRI